MNKAKKLALGTMAVAVITAGAGLPALSGYLLEQKIQNDLATTVERYGFSAASVDIERHYSDSTINIILKGEGLRELSQETLSISGTLKHSTLLSLATMGSGELKLNYSLVTGEDTVSVPATLQGRIGWGGQLSAHLTTDNQSFPLVGETNITLNTPRIEADIVADSAETMVKLAAQDWLVQDDQTTVYYTVSPSTLSVSADGNEWSMSVPNLTMKAGAANTSGTVNLFSITDMDIASRLETKGDLLSGNYSFSTGTVDIPILSTTTTDGSPLITGVKLSSSFDAVSQTALASFLSLAQNATPQIAETATMDAATLKAFETLTKTSPKVSIDELTFKTQKGDARFAFDLTGSEQLSNLFSSFQGPITLSPEQQQEFTVNVIDTLVTSARAQFSDSLIDWGCEQMGTTISQVKGDSVTDAFAASQECKALAASGDFLAMPCMDIIDQEEQTQCLTSMEEAKKVWAENKEITLSLEEGRFSLNGAQIASPISI